MERDSFEVAVDLLRRSVTVEAIVSQAVSYAVAQERRDGTDNFDQFGFGAKEYW